MNNVCDFCEQPREGVIFMCRNEKGEREERHICFDCIVERAQVGVDLAEVKRGVSTAFSIVSDIDGVNEDSTVLTTQRGDTNGTIDR